MKGRSKIESTEEGRTWKVRRASFKNVLLPPWVKLPSNEVMGFQSDQGTLRFW